MNAPEPIKPNPKPGLTEVDVDLYTFVQRYATNLVRWDLLMYFSSHPNRHATAAQIAQQVRRNLRATLKELDDLAYLKVILRQYRQGEAFYSLPPNGEQRQLVERLADMFNEPA